MKNVIFMFLLAISCSLTAYAEPVSKALSTDVVDVVCMPGDAVCDIVLVNGQTLNIEFIDLTSYLSVEPSAKFVFDDDTFRYNEKGEVVSLSPKKFGGASKSQQPVQQQASEPPVDIKARLNAASNAFGGVVNHVDITVLVPEITIHKVIINRNPKCNDNDSAEKVMTGKVKSKFTMGEHKKISTVCDPIEVTVETDQGYWTQTFR